MTNRQRVILLAISAAVVVAGVAVWLVAILGREAPPVAGAPPRVAELMTRAGCAGTVIETQLYSRETGRCKLGRAEVTIAAFDDNRLRDRWVAVAREFGGSLVTGDRWAAGVSGPDQAAQLAAKLGGAIA